ncbi:RING-type E3 ubiquitin transferase [Malassezia brasiliensis]|uniref:RING-type E3 ubiquitin transferase n=1 Tax=Malassezia brasiliensis TaxID=1821822 RepID=A0AAF0IP20_9BASI|nr:RING-type E3 ubiquitin transferase [Malassezia brasiliensis]
MKNSGNETYGRFQEVDTFEVEPARDEWSDSEVQHDVRVAFGIVHLFRLLGDDFDDEVVSGQPAEPPEETEEDPIGTILGMVSVPSHVDFENNLVLLKFRDTVDAEEFYKMYNGRPFQALDTPAIDEDHPSSSTEGASRATHCERCGSATDLWVCLICAHVGCGRYKQGHAREHFAETGHLYSLELETQRVWDYAGDGYVHRLIQSKSDGKLVELPSASSVAAATPEKVWNARYPGAVQARSAMSNTAGNGDASISSHPTEMHLLEEKMQALGLEYSNMIMSQLDSQRIYYEGLLAMVRSERIPREETEQVRSEYAALQAKYEQGEARCAELQKELATAHAQASRYETQLRRAVESARALKKERDEEKSVSDGLYKHIQQLQEEQKALQTRVADLSEELRDVMFYVSARDKVQEMDQVLPAQESLKDGAAYVPDPPTKPRNVSRKAKGRRP